MRVVVHPVSGVTRTSTPLVELRYLCARHSSWGTPGLFPLNMSALIFLAICAPLLERIRCSNFLKVELSSLLYPLNVLLGFPTPCFSLHLTIFPFSLSPLDLDLDLDLCSSGSESETL